MNFLFLSTLWKFRNALSTLQPPPGSPPCLALQKQQFTVPDNRWHQIPFALPWKHTVVLHVLGVPLCQKWTGRHRAVPLVMGRGPDCRLFQREGEGGSCFQLTVSFSSFLALTPLFLCLNCFHHCLCFCALCFTFSSAASVVSFVSVFFDQCVLYRVHSFTLIT